MPCRHRQRHVSVYRSIELHIAPAIEVGASELAGELDRVADSFSGRQGGFQEFQSLRKKNEKDVFQSPKGCVILCAWCRVTDDKDVDFYSDCIAGRFSLELLLLLTHPGVILKHFVMHRI